MTVTAQILSRPAGRQPALLLFFLVLLGSSWSSLSLSLSSIVGVDDANDANALVVIRRGVSSSLKGISSSTESFESILHGSAGNSNNTNNKNSNKNTAHHPNVKEAIDLLISVGVPRENLCRAVPFRGASVPDVDNRHARLRLQDFWLPPCPIESYSNNDNNNDDNDNDNDDGQSLKSTEENTSFTSTTKKAPQRSNRSSSRWIRSRRERYRHLVELLQPPGQDNSEDDDDDDDDDDESSQHDDWFYISHAVCALICVTTAALAAGLTMGLLSLDPLLLLIKVRAASTQKEKDQASALLPIVKQHHLLLVTLLLMNSLANEALPLFLEVLVSPLLSVILSVTLVLFFGEIIPSAIFTGPNKVDIAFRMVPVVKLAMLLLWPLAFPIAKLLDHVLHDEDAESGDMFARGELSALVRIQYEERMAHKNRQKSAREVSMQSSAVAQARKESGMVDNIGALDFASTQAIKASKKTVDRVYSSTHDASDMTVGAARTSKRSIQTQAQKLTGPFSTVDENDPLLTRDDSSNTRSTSIHLDEVSMVEGALSMKTKMALDVYTPLHRMVSIPYDMILTERNVVAIYSRGFSRIPVFQPNPDKPKSATAICGVLMTKQLIVVNPNESRPLSTLPLYRPRCVSPKMNLVDLINLFQTGRAGHLALVCARPKKGEEALKAGKPLPEIAGLMGIVTLEDVLEALLQEQIYDESDKYEREANRIAKWATQKWKSYVRRKRRDRSSAAQAMIHHNQLSMGTVVQQAMAADEKSRLLPRGDSANNHNQSGNFDPIGGMMQFFQDLTKKK